MAGASTGQPDEPSTPPTDTDRDLAIAAAMAEAARSIAVPLFRAGLAGDNKSADCYDPVTKADTAIEAALREILAAERPGDGVVGEEGDDSPSETGRWWVIDPIDGTRAFIAGLPTWCVLIALCDETGPLLSVIDQPYTDERFTGVTAGGRMEAWCEHGGVRRALCARQEAKLDSAVLSTTDPYLFSAGERAAFDGLRQRARIVRYGLDAYGYAALALGGIDLVVESGLKAWDVAALVPVVRGAGGLVTDWGGAPSHHGGQVLAAANPELHAEALAALREAAS